MKNYFLLFVSIALSSFGFAQIGINTTMTPAQLVNNILVGSGVTASNITVNGSAANANVAQVSATNFTQNGTTFPINGGLLLSTGSGMVAMGPNTATGESNSSGSLTVNDADMNSIAAATVTNGIVLEFDFIATGNQLEFNYIFGSEEYPEFAPPNSSSFNDIFGFFLSGPGLAGPFLNGAVNIATVPGSTTPVSINNVNPITNAAYYVNNTGGLAYGNAIEYDGTTTTLTAFSELICGETYHIKLGIANVGDQAWDSGVFLEGGSFTTNPIAFTFDTYTLDSVVYEGCDQLGTLMFTRQGCGNENDTLVAYTTFGGVAINGTDYALLGDSVVLLPGVDTLYWQILPTDDGIAEGTEVIDITIMSILITGDTVYTYGTFYIADPIPVTLNTVDQTYLCNQDSVMISVQTTGGVGPFSYLWVNTDTNDTTYVPNLGSGPDTYQVVVTDACGTIGIDSVTVSMIPPTSVTVTPTHVTLFCYQDSTDIYVTASGGAPPYTYDWDAGGTTDTITVPINGNGVVGYPVTVTDDCGIEGSATVFVNMNQTISIDSILMTPATCEPVGTTHAYISGFSNPQDITYDWTNRADTNIVYPNADSLFSLGGEWYILTITDNNIPCSVTDSVFVTTINTPQAIASVVNNYGCSPLNATFSNNSINSTSYVWDFGDGTVINTTNTNSQSHTFTSSSTVTLTASNGNPICDNVTVIPIQIIECGCQDPNAINYNPLAVQDDGSCIYPIPTVVAPNVITANGDNVNGFFFLQTTYAHHIEFTILNRWGNEIYTATGDQLNQPMWSGENKNGQLVEDGVYFYRYKVTGIQGDVVEGHGFVEVVR